MDIIKFLHGLGAELGGRRCCSRGAVHFDERRRLMVQCPVCGGMFTDRCERCRGHLCDVCGQPVFLDESVVRNAHGRRHARCARGPVPRPEYMVDMEPIITELAVSPRVGTDRP